MHFNRPLVCAFVALLLCTSVISVFGHVQLHNRRDLGLLPRATTEVTTTPTPTATGSDQNTAGPKSTASNNEPKESPSKTLTDEPVATSAAAAASGTGIFEDGNNTGDNTQQDVYRGGLPIQPKITPGLSVAGIILMIAGLCCCLIGIKIKRLHIFLSTAYLASLATTVLIVYVMNAPISNAIEGAYVVAVVITGSIVGGLAVVFPEVTEGLGCLLGGFCLSMWFLVLKPGGLITSVYGKLIMIGVFCCAVFALAFHKITRPWGLIASLAFSGSTSLVLGIDCYSRAGFKEFWVYIWSLNDDLFPLGTNTYPHTRGMKVEIAAIIIIFAIGVMSQMKLWKILQERRDAKDVQRRQYEADLEAADEETGRRVEAEYHAERDRWEKIYGDPTKSNVTESTRPATGGSKPDSGLGDDEIRASGEAAQGFVETDEMKEARAEHAQMADMAAEMAEDTPKSGEVKSPTGSAPGSRRNSVEVSRRQSVHSSKSGRRASRHSIQSIQTITDELGQIVDRESLHDRTDVPPPPTVIPLPIPIPIPREDGDDANSDASSVAAAADSVHCSVIMEEPEGSELRLPYNADKRVSMASSLVATCDDQLEVDGDLPEVKRLSTNSSINHPIEVAKDDEHAGKSLRESCEMGSEQLPIPELKSQPKDETTVKQDDCESSAAKRASLESSSSLAKLSADNTSTITPVSSPPPISKVEQPIPPPSVLPQDLLPASYPKSKPSSSMSRGSAFEVQTCSKVVKTYRTNEWAKHLAEADKPELDDLAVCQEIGDSDEQPAHLDFQGLQGTAEVASKPASRKETRKATQSSQSPVSTIPPNLISHHSTSVPLPAHSAVPTLEQSTSAPPAAVERSPPGPLIERATSAAAIREDRFPAPQGTLLGQRENRVRSRASYLGIGAHDSPSSTSTPLPWNPMDHRSASAMSFAQNSRTPMLSRTPAPPQPSSQILSDDMPLANRQQLLHQSMSQQSYGWNPPPQQQRRGTPMPQHLPDKRAEVPGTRRDGKKLQNATNLVDQRRAQMLNERNRAAMAERQKAMQVNFNGGAMEERMRQRDMQELHREALRKMQASANKNVR